MSAAEQAETLQASIDEALERFEKVVSDAAKRNDKAVVDLFDKLAVSVKFAEETKPACFAYLVQFCVENLDKAETMLPALARHAAMQHVLTYRPKEWEQIASALVRRVLSVKRPEGAEVSLVAVMRQLISAGVCKDRGELFSLAVFAKMAPERLDTIADQTYPYWYV